MTNLEALKKLAAKMIGGETSIDDVPGNTIAEVIDVIAKNYQGTAPLILGELTVASVTGSAQGKTKLTVTPALTAGNSYRYKIDPSGVELPERNEDLSSWVSWDGTSEIEAEDGHKICVCEVDSNFYALKGGVTIVASI